MTGQRFKPLFLLLLLSATACATYHPLPLDKKAEAQALAPPDMGRVTVEAAQIHHPLLKPVHLDLARGLTPDELAIVAVLTNPQLRAVRDQRGLAHAQVIQAGLLPNPVASYGQDKPTGGSDQGTVTAYTTGMGFDLTSLLTYSLRKEAAKSQAQAVDLDVAWQEWQVAQAARMAAYHLLALREQVPFARKGMEEAQQTLDAMHAAAKAGAVSQADEALALSAFEQARQTFLLLSEAETRARQDLNQMLGLPPGSKPPLREEATLPDWRAIPDEQLLVRGLADRRLDLLAFKKGYESQDTQLRIAIRSQFPNIGIDLSHSRDTSNIVTTGYGVAISLPIFDRNQGRIAYERATRRQMYDEFQSRLFDARAQVAQILSRLDSVRRQLATAEDTLSSLRTTAEGYEKAKASGAVDLVSAQNAQQAYLSQAMTVASLKAERADLGVALEVASGEVLPADTMGAATPKGGNRP
ncbi:MAG: TolC family protein [Acidobacteriota bacterium]